MKHLTLSITAAIAAIITAQPAPVTKNATEPADADAALIAADSLSWAAYCHAYSLDPLAAELDDEAIAAYLDSWRGTTEEENALPAWAIDLLD